MAELWGIPDSSGGGAPGPTGTGWTGGWGGTADPWNPHGQQSPYYTYLEAVGHYNQDPSTSTLPQTNPTASHYYQGFWAGVEAALYGFGGGLAGAALGGPFGAALGVEGGSAAGFAIEAVLAHMGASVGKYFAGGAGGGPPANDNWHLIGGPGGDDTVIDEQGIRWVNFGPGGGHEGLALPGAVWEPLGDRGFSDLTLREQRSVELLQEPNALFTLGINVIKMRNWLWASFPVTGATPLDSQLFNDFLLANRITDTHDSNRWDLTIEDSRVPVYSPEAVTLAAVLGTSPQGAPIGSYRAMIGPDGFIRTDTTTLLPYGNIGTMYVNPPWVDLEK